MRSRNALDPIQIAFLASDRSSGVIRDDPRDIMRVNLLGDTSVQRLADHRRRERRQHRALIELTPSTQMGNLAHDPRPLSMDTLRELLKVRNDLVDADIELRHHRRRVD